MHPYKVALAASTALLASTSLSLADTITVTNSYSATTDWGASSADSGFSPTQNLSFTGFNTSLGTLTSVSIELIDSISGDVNITNSGADATKVSASLLNTLKYLFPSISTTSISLESNVYQDPSLGSGDSTGPQSVSGSTSTTQLVTTDLSDFETDWVVTAGDIGFITVSADNGDGSATYTDTGSLDVVVTYNYTPTSTTTSVPEPSSMAILGTGLVGLGLLRRRRKSA
jgi:PEP-CTERM motif